MKQITFLFRFGFIVTLMKKLLLFLILLCLWPVWAGATTYYVSNSGRDSSNGTSTSTPWQTIAHVNAQTFKPGDSILFQAGGTWREQLTVHSSGSAGSPITFGGYGSGALPVIDAQFTRNYAVYAASQSYVTLNGLDMRNGATVSYGTVTFYQPSGASQTGITVENCNVNGGTTYGINVWRTNNITISNNTVSNIQGIYGSIRVSGDSTSRSGVSVTNNTVHDSVFGIATVDYDSVTISGNTVYNIHQYGINHNAQNRSTSNLIISGNEVYDTPLATSGAYSEIGYGGVGSYTATGVSVHDNYLHDSVKAGSQIDGVCLMSDVGSSTALSPARIYNNHFRNCQGGCVEIMGGPSGNVGTEVYYNVMSGCGVGGVGTTQRATVGLGGGATLALIYNNSSYGPYSGIRLVSYSTAIAKNNIIAEASHTNVYQETGSTVTSDYNDYSADGAAMFSLNGTGYNFSGWKTNSSHDTHSVNSNPLFTNGSGVYSLAADFTLQAGSPAIWAGVNVRLTTDYAGNQVHNPPSFGAYEYGETVPAAPQSLRIGGQ